ncbi:MAG: dTMP kinase [Gemmatimonadota bacterium]|nr:dTMP kinase [Gemmatimonadota bacterium]
MSNLPGAFVVVDGPDGSGKTTLAARLVERLSGNGWKVLSVRQPGGTPLAEVARNAALAPEMEASPLAELFLMLAARADQVSKVIRPALESGAIVISDRYDLSTQAYQIAGRDLPREEVLQANRLATDGLVPDLTIVLDLSVEVSRERQRVRGEDADRIEKESSAWHEKISETFRDATGQGLVHVNADRTPDEVLRDSWVHVEQTLLDLFGMTERDAG